MSIRAMIIHMAHFWGISNQGAILAIVSEARSYGQSMRGLLSQSNTVVPPVWYMNQEFNQQFASVHARGGQRRLMRHVRNHRGEQHEPTQARP